MGSSSWLDPRTVTPQAIRESWLPKMLLLSRLLDMLSCRLTFCVGLARRARGTPSDSPHQYLDLLYQTWLLAENTFSLLEALADPDGYDVRTADGRRRLLDAIGGRSLTKGLGGFIKKAWGMRALKHVFTEEVFLARGFTVAEGRMVLEGLISRNQAVLKEAYTSVRAFRMKYGEVCRAHKHGRAAFGLRMKSRRTDAAGGTKITLTKAPGELSVFRPPRTANGDDAALIRLTVDEELRGDIGRALEILTVQIPLLGRRMRLLHVVCVAYLSVLEGRLPEDHTAPYPLDLFVPPYSAEELRLLGIG